MKKLSSIIVKMFAMALVSSMLMLTGCSGSSKTKVAYVKDNELYLDGNIINQQLFHDFYDESGKQPNASDYKKTIQISEDGNIIYYPEEFMTGSCYPLYCKNNGSTPVKVCDSVSSYQISNDGKTAAYLDKDGYLHKFDGSQSTMLRKGVGSYKISKDGNRILYVTSENELCLYDKSSGLSSLGKELFQSGIDFSTRSDDNLDTIYFITNIPTREVGTTDERGSRLYCCTNGKDVVQVGSNVAGPMDMMYFQETDELYYLSSESYTYYNYTDYLVNDLGGEGEQKLEDLKEGRVAVSVHSLWHCDGKQSKKIATNIGIVGKRVKDNKATLVFKQYKTAPIEKMPLSKVTKTQIIDEHIKSIYNCFDNISVTSNGKTSVLSKTNKSFYALTDDAVYYNDGKNAVGGGVIYKAKLTNGVADEELTEIKNVFHRAMLNDSIVYIQNFKSNSGEMYIDGKKIADNVLGYTTYTDNNGNEQMYFLTDYDRESYTATLKLYIDGKLETVAEKVSYDKVRNIGNDLVYINNYDKEKQVGDLCIYSNGKSKKIDSGVSSFVME